MSKPLLVLVIALMIISFYNGTGFNGYDNVTKEFTPSGQLVKITREYQPGKSLWDWLQLLIIPVVLGIGGFWLSQIQKSSEQRTTTDNQREAALQGYFDKMSELLLEKHLSESQPEDEVRNIARARTLTVLAQLDADRKLSLVRFLAEARLLDIIRLDDVNLSGIHLYDIDLSHLKFTSANLMHGSLKNSRLDYLDLNHSDMSHAEISHSRLTHSDLSYVNLSQATLASVDLSNSSLVGAILSDAEFMSVDLSGANLQQADLSGANLKGVIGITIEELEKQAKSLQGAILPDGSKHP
jgi:uncharacterized protein YjbI with pentapeptide repeats